MSDASNGNGTAGGTGRTAFEAVPWAAGALDAEAERLIFERSSPGRRASSFPDGGGLPEADLGASEATGAASGGDRRREGEEVAR